MDLPSGITDEFTFHDIKQSNEATGSPTATVASPPTHHPVRSRTHPRAPSTHAL